MPTWLNVAEKPSVAKQISAVLANGSPGTTRSHSKYNPVFQFPYRGVTMLVTSVAGHLMEEDFTGAARSWSGFPMRDLFTAPVTKTVKASLKDLQTNLETLMKRADTLVLWLDCDREGENIGFEVLQIAQSVKQRFTTKRAHFSALTQRDIQNAIDRLREPDRKLSEAVDARQEMDLRIGAAFTRYQTLRLRDSLPGISGVVSFGPCQFPTLGFVIRREWDRMGFLPEDVFTFRLYHERSVFSGCRGEIYDQMAATVLFQDMLQRAGVLRRGDAATLGDADEEAVAVVVEVRQRQNHRRRPVPLATVTMQKLAATHLHISSEQCMKLAESLYQEGFLSYPRTETDYFSFTDAELLEFVSIQTSHAVVGTFAQKMLDDTGKRFCKPLNGGHNDKAHPPIHPTKLFNGDPNQDKYKLYLLIAQHFLACISPDAIDAQTSVKALFGGEVFTTTGSTIVEKGWTEVFPYGQRTGTSVIPNYTLHQTFVPTAVKMEKSVTAPPPRLTETALISVMDENGIGTDATIAQHIKTLIDRQYVTRVGQSMVPMPLGMALGATYEVLGLASLLQPQLRAQMEAAMGDITVGKASKEDVLQAAVKFYREVFDRLSSRGDEFRGLVRHFFQGGSGTVGRGVPSAPSGALSDTGEPINEEVSSAAEFLTEVEVVPGRYSLCGKCRRPLRLVRLTADDPAMRRWLQCVECREQYRLPSARYVDLHVTDPPVTCPLCGFTALLAEPRESSARRGSGRGGYTLCPHCFHHRPAAQYVADVESIGDFRCFQCLHPTCALAKGKEQIGIAKCIACGTNDLRLRRHPNSSGAYLSCSGYPQCLLKIGLPKATAIEPQPQQRCPHCQSVMLTFDFRGVQAVPGLEEVETICVYCDIRIKDYLVLLQRGGVELGSTPAPPSFHSSSTSSLGAGSSSTDAAYTLPSIHTVTATRGRGGRGQRGRGSGGLVAAAPPGPAVNCGCGVPAKQLVSRQERSSGRAFWTCASRQCSFFEWCEPGS